MVWIMLITTRFDIGDKVKYGPNYGVIIRIFISSMGALYEVEYWVEDHPMSANAYDWQLSIVEKVDNGAG